MTNHSLTTAIYSERATCIGVAAEGNRPPRSDVRVRSVQHGQWAWCEGPRMALAPAPGSFAGSLGVASGSAQPDHSRPGAQTTAGPACNKCRQSMALAKDAVVPLWRCSCGREVVRWPGDTTDAASGTKQAPR